MSDSEHCGNNTSQDGNSCYPVKRARHSSAWKDDDDDDDVAGTEMATRCRKTNYVTDAIVKFLVSINAPVDSYKDSHFRTLLSRVAQYGVPPCLLREDSLPIQRSLWSLENVVNEHIREVKDSWKTTGCTMMLYKLDEVEGSLSTFHRDNLVFGFYSIKGFFFVEGRSLPRSDSLHGAFKSHVLNLPIHNVTQAIYHEKSGQPCELSAVTSDYKWFCDLKKEPSVSCMPCVNQTINQSLRQFSETSGCWVQEVMKRSEIIHNYILDKYLYLDWEKGKARMVVDGVHGGWFRRFQSVMLLESELKTWLLNLPAKIKSSLVEIATIIDSREFWRDGERLNEFSWHLSDVPDVLDKLIPTSGYLQPAIYAAVDDSELARYGIDGQYFQKLLSGRHFSKIQEAATFLSPGFYLYHQEGKSSDLIEGAKYGLESIVGEEDKEAMHVELEAFTIRSSNPFANLEYEEILEYHPVALWYKYGNEFPILKKYAMKLLSQAASCMCKQVKKHLSQIEGKDNLVLRLNYRMMEEFKQLRDCIYNHVEI